MNIPFARPWLTDEDRAAVMAVLQGPILAHGPRAKDFEQAFAAFLGEGAHCISVSSGMAALHLAYLHFGIGPGDEVVVPAQTHVATVHAVEMVGARPLFVDCDPVTGNLTAERIEAALTPRTRAISVVHFVGIPCNVEAIAGLAARRHLTLIEDCALAVGTRYAGRHAGLWGDVGCFSFYPVKHLTTGEGGMFVTRRPEVAASVGRLRAFGVDRSHTERKLPGMYDVPGLGVNYRMSEIQAALGLGQVRRLEDNLSRRAQNFRALGSALADIDGLRILDAADRNALNSHYCMSVVLPGRASSRRDQIAVRLQDEGIGTSVYYPHPVPRLKYYREKYGYDARAFPGAEEVSDRSIALPVGPHLEPSDAEAVGQALRRAVKEALA